uniref:Uncharacterized protein n=1 Tax=Lygus hesperus TaxID=30085 RepID=A0A0A9XBU2_LYGHE
MTWCHNVCFTSPPHFMRLILLVLTSIHPIIVITHGNNTKDKNHITVMINVSSLSSQVLYETPQGHMHHVYVKWCGAVANDSTYNRTNKVSMITKMKWNKIEIVQGMHFMSKVALSISNVIIILTVNIVLETHSTHTSRAHLANIKKPYCNCNK